MSQHDLSDVGSRRGGVWIALAVILALLCGGAAGWAVTTVFASPGEQLISADHTYVEVARGRIGSSILLAAEAQWGYTVAGANRATGVVTSVDVKAGQDVTAGTELYSVELRPVVIAQGQVPAFRDLTQEDIGEDVLQLQEFLASQGLYAAAPDGVFGAETTSAVGQWQSSLGLSPDGRVRLGDLIFVPRLPTRVSLDNQVVAVGRGLSGGETVVRSLADEPTFTVPVTDTQARMAPVGTEVRVTGPRDTVWTGSVRSAQTGGTNTTLVVDGLGRGPLCGDRCTAIPPQGVTLLDCRVITTRTQHGLVVPTAALTSLADGSVAVIDRDGRRHEVEVVDEADGISVVTGANAGTEVRVPAASG